jgi:hypothetical protein
MVAFATRQTKAGSETIYIYSTNGVKATIPIKAF